MSSKGTECPNCSSAKFVPGGVVEVDSRDRCTVCGVQLMFRGDTLGSYLDIDGDSWFLIKPVKPEDFIWFDPDDGIPFETLGAVMTVTFIDGRYIYGCEVC